MHEAQGRTMVLIDVGELADVIESAVRRALEESGHTPADEWLDAEAAAEVIGVCSRTLIKRAKAGELPSSRIGKLWRFRRADLDEYLRAG